MAIPAHNPRQIASILVRIGDRSKLSARVKAHLASERVIDGAKREQKYFGKWVGAFEGSVRAVADKKEFVEQELSRFGIDPDEACIRFVDPEPAPIIG